MQGWQGPQIPVLVEFVAKVCIALVKLIASGCNPPFLLVFLVVRGQPCTAFQKMACKSHGFEHFSGNRMTNLPQKMGLYNPNVLTCFDELHFLQKPKFFGHAHCLISNIAILFSSLFWVFKSANTSISMAGFVPITKVKVHLEFISYSLLQTFIH